MRYTYIDQRRFFSPKKKKEQAFRVIDDFVFEVFAATYYFHKNATIINSPLIALEKKSSP